MFNLKQLWTKPIKKLNVSYSNFLKNPKNKNRRGHLLKNVPEGEFLKNDSVQKNKSKQSVALRKHIFPRPKNVTRTRKITKRQSKSSLPRPKNVTRTRKQSRVITIPYRVYEHYKKEENK
jgi:hypothetical protein